MGLLASAPTLQRMVADLSIPLHSSVRYTRTAVALRWLLAVLIVGDLVLGLYRSGLSFSMTRLKPYNRHKRAGIVNLTLSAARLAWRLPHLPPASMAMPASQQRAAQGTTLLLYALFFAVP